MKLVHLIGVLFVSLAIMVGCGSGSTPADDTYLPQGCVPGDTQACLCVGGGSGVQICSDDGTRWNSCQGCGVVTDIVGDDVQVDTVITDDTSADVVADVVADTVQPVRGACSATGVDCDMDSDCEPSSVEISGFCVIRNDNDSSVECIYNARFDTGSMVSCEGNSVFKCESVTDCPAGLICGTFADNWCETNVTGVCTNLMSAGISECTDNSVCARDIANYCVRCGSSHVDGIMEECDDGGLEDGDGCSSTCMFEWLCYDELDEVVYGAECATADDCIDVCPRPPCTCAPAL